MARKYLVRTFGCQMNEHDSERIAGVLEADGLEATDEVAEADVVVLNTCCIRENADNKLYGTLGHLKSEKARRPDLEIVVGGCLAQKDREVVQQRAPHVDVVMGTHNVGRVGDLLASARELGPTMEILEATAAEDHEAFPSALPAKRQQGWAAWVTIQFGCDNSCAFCIVPAVRGPEISRPFGDVVEEVARVAAEGVTEVTLLGQNVDSYGRDLTLRLRNRAGNERSGEPVDASGVPPSDAFVVGEAWLAEQAAAGGSGRARPLFADLLRAVGSVPGIRRVRYTSPHPKDMRPETIAAMAETPAVCEHLHLPMQSGSDAVLTAMHRGYTAERYLRVAADAKAGVEDLALTTDVIVGFPGETEADFQATLEVCAEAQFDSAYTFVYSPRPGTEAAELTGAFVDHAVSVERMERLRAIIERSAIRANEARIGRIDEVVVTGPSRRDPSMITGLTRHNKRIHLPGPPGARPRPGTYLTARVTEARMTSLVGEIVDVGDAPAHRTRIPVTAG
ncbi:MAG: MiaB/RimO family radical SAM methylthiotransferase [Microthrixaceae bacterium]